MSSAPTPNHPHRLPSNWFTTPCPVSNSSFSPLRMTFRPSLLIPTPLVSPQVLGRSKLEECLHVIVPIGGKVEVVLTVDQEGLGEQGEDIDLGNLIGARFQSIFKSNSSTLALSPLEPILISHPDTQRIILNPLTSSPSHTYLNSHLLPSTHPIAYLTKLEVHFSWPPLPRRANPVVAGEDQVTIALRQQAEDTAVNQEHEEVLSWEDDKSDEAPADLRHEDDEMILWDGDQEDAENVVSASTLLNPQPALHAQIRQAIFRFVREQLIRRFSLIFDGSLLKYSRTLVLPTALPLALTRFLALSLAHKTPLAQTAKPLIKSIKSAQSQMLNDRVEQIVDLPIRKNKRKRPEQVEDVPESQESSQPSPDQGSRSRSNQRRKKVEAPEEELHPEERAVAYIASQNQKMQEQNGDGCYKDEKQMRRVVGEAMAHIGHVNFERRRKRGRMRYGAIKLSFNDGTIGDSSTPSSDSHHMQHHDGAVPSDLLSGMHLTSDPPSDDQELILDDFNEEFIHFENEDDFQDEDEDGQTEVELDDCDDLISDDEAEDDSQLAYECNGDAERLSVNSLPLTSPHILYWREEKWRTQEDPSVRVLTVDPNDTWLNDLTNGMQVSTSVSLEANYDLREDDDLILYDEDEET